MNDPLMSDLAKRLRELNESIEAKQNDRDCEHCIHRVPRLDKEEGIWKGADCEMWDCEYLNRQVAIDALKEIGLVKRW